MPTDKSSELAWDSLHAEIPISGKRTLVKRADLVIDVSDSNGPAVTLQSAVSVYAPDKISAGRTIVVFAFPGGGFSRHYYDIHLETGARFSQVEHHVNHGLIVVTVDYLGTGGSVFPDLDLLDLEVVGLGAQAP